jgi:hypothetical protein
MWLPTDCVGEVCQAMEERFDSFATEFLKLCTKLAPFYSSLPIFVHRYWCVIDCSYCYVEWRPRFAAARMFSVSFREQSAIRNALILEQVSSLLILSTETP